LPANTHSSPSTQFVGDLEFYATCGAGLATVLAEECQGMGLSGVQIAGSGVRFRGTLSDGYRACLCSRVANRVLLPIHRGEASTPDELYALVQTIDWNQHIRVDGTLAVDFYTASSAITHSQYGALKVKDGIVDQFREATGQRPSVDREEPDVRVNVYLFRNTARIAIDLSGSSLHRRGYRRSAGIAPLKENLAAAILLASGWPEACQRGEALFDPLCGSGTLLIEAALIATRRAPGLGRQYFGFLGWKHHAPELWGAVVKDAESQIQASPVTIVGADHDAQVVDVCRSNILQAGLSDEVQVAVHAVNQGRPEQLQSGVEGMIVSNPPYGERLATDPAFYTAMGADFSRYFPGWSCAMFTAVSAPHGQMRLPLRNTLAARNGGIDCVLLMGRIPNAGKTAAQAMEQTADQAPESADASEHRQRSLYRDKREDIQVDATPFINRLRKNKQALKGWIKQNKIYAYRLYDADLPEFAVAIDLFHSDNLHCVVQEYQAPDTVNVAMAQARLDALLAALPDALQVDPQNIHLKVRQVQHGREQYARLSSSNASHAYVDEFGAMLELNFTHYLDVGLFLDHRPVRRYLAQNAQGKRFLNLFAYTASATVAAVRGGAASSVSVDASNRYCQWAKRNLERNNAAAQQHEVVRQDVFNWLEGAALGLSEDRRFDIILLDPPTFSNSTDQDTDWNLQRDHVAAIDACLNVLRPGGLLIFSNNYRRFKLDAQLSDGSRSIQVEDRSRWSIDRDFQRKQRIHQCWFIRSTA